MNPVLSISTNLSTLKDKHPTQKVKIHISQQNFRRRKPRREIEILLLNDEDYWPVPTVVSPPRPPRWRRPRPSPLGLLGWLHDAGEWVSGFIEGHDSAKPIFSPPPSPPPSSSSSSLSMHSNLGLSAASYAAVQPQSKSPIPWRQGGRTGLHNSVSVPQSRNAIWHTILFLLAWNSQLGPGPYMDLCFIVQTVFRNYGRVSMLKPNTVQFEHLNLCFRNFPQLPFSQPLPLI